MSVYSWPTGLGQGTGDNLVVDAPLMTTLLPLFVSSIYGSDSNVGLQEEAPLATLVHAVSVAGGLGVPTLIVLMPGHAETITSTISLGTDGMIIAGAGASGSIPSVTLTLDASNQSMLSLEAAGIQIRGVGFASSLQSTNKAIIGAAASATAPLIKGCYFELGQHDWAAIELVASHYAKILETTVISVGTTAALRPDYAIRLSAGEATPPKDVDIIDCVISNGTHGYVNVPLTVVGTAPRLRIERLSPLLGSDINLDTSTGLLMTSSTGASGISWSG